MGIDIVRAPAPMPAAPALNATIILFATRKCTIGTAEYTPREGALRSAGGLSMVEFTWIKNNQASAANGVRLYTFDASDAVREVDLKDENDDASIGSGAVTPVQVPILASGEEWHLALEVSRYSRGVAVTYTAGTAPTEWDLMVNAYFNAFTVQK